MSGSLLGHQPPATRRSAAYCHWLTTLSHRLTRPHPYVCGLGHQWSSPTLPARLLQPTLRHGKCPIQHPQQLLFHAPVNCLTHPPTHGRAGTPAVLQSTPCRLADSPNIYFLDLLRLKTQLQQDCSLNFNDEATTAPCSLLFAHTHGSKR